MIRRMPGRTQKTYTKPTGRFSAISIENKDPGYDYSLVRSAEIANGSKHVWMGADREEEQQR